MTMKDNVTEIERTNQSDTKDGQTAPLVPLTLIFVGGVNKQDIMLQNSHKTHKTSSALSGR